MLRSVKMVAGHGFKKNSVGSHIYFPMRNLNFALKRNNVAVWNCIEHRSFSLIATEPLESLGDSITTAVLLQWNKKAGDVVKEDDVIAIVETDKVTMDIRAKKAGIFVEGLAAPQSEVVVGSALYTLDVEPGAQSSVAVPIKPVEAPIPSASATKTITVKVPVMGESITTGILAKWICGVNDNVSVDQVVASIETDKVTVDVRSPLNGSIAKIYAEEGQEVNVDEVLFDIAPGAGVTASAAKVTTVAVAAEKKDAAPVSVSPAPAAKKDSTTTAKAADTNKATAAPVGDRSETRVKMTRMRQRIAQRLKESQNTSAMLTTFQEVDMSNLIELRNRYKEDFEKAHGVKLGFMSAFVRACSSALLETPAVNAVIDDSTNEIVYRNYNDISVAVASPTGLVVPVLRNTEKMSFSDIEKAIGSFGKRAKEGTLALEDMTGGTFTISNGGVFGSLFGTPIINPPQSAILGMHATKMRAVVVNGKVEARPMMYLALTYDHRMIDGREAVTFLKSVAGKIEDPGRLLLSV